MAEALIKGMTAQGMRDIMVSEPKQERRRFLEQQYKVVTTGENRQVVSACDIVILAVKPQVMNEVADEISSAVTGSTTIVSIAAGITLAYLSSKFRTEKIIRVMPNTPALVQKGMTVMSLCECFDDREITVVRQIFMSVGEVITLPEKYMNAVTAVSGSGPGFFAYFIEAVIKGAVRAGLSNDDARTLAVQTAIGTSYLLETGMSPSRLREMVTSPGGTTAAGLETFDAHGFTEVVSSAVEAAKQRAEELGKDIL